MSIPIIGPVVSPFIPGVSPLPLLPDTVPFTARSGATFAEEFYKYKDHFDNTIIPQLNAEKRELVEAWNKQIESIVENIAEALDDQAGEVNGALAELESQFNTGMAEVAKAVEDITSSSIAVQAPVVKGILDPKLLLVTPDRYNVFTNQVQSSHLGIQKAIDDAPSGTRVALFGNMKCSGQVRIPLEKNLTLDFTSANVDRDFAGTMFYGEQKYDAPYKPTGYVTVTEEVAKDQKRTFTVLTFPVDGIPPYAAGDWLRVVADNIIPEENYNEGDTGHQRIGEYASVVDVVANTVKLKGVLRDPYSDNTRVFRVGKGTVNIIGLRGGVTDRAWAAKERGRTLRLAGALNPVIDNPYITRENNYPISLVACFGHVARNIFAETLTNDPQNGYYGYTIHEQSCENGLIDGIKSLDQRHGWTDGIALSQPNDPNPFNYGRNQNGIVRNAMTTATTQSGLDTHHGSRGMTFDTCLVVGAFGALNAYALRGESHTIKNSTSWGCNTSVAVFTEKVSGESRNHCVIGHTAYNARQLFAVNIHHVAPRNDLGVRDTFMNLIATAITAIGVASTIFARNARVRINGLSHVSPEVVDVTNVTLQNSEVVINGYHNDATGVKTYTAPNYFTADDTSIIEVNGRVDMSAAMVAQLPNTRTYQGSDLVDTVKLDIKYNRYFSSNPHVIPMTAKQVVNEFEYDTRSDMTDAEYNQAATNSGHVEIRDADIENEVIVWRISRSSKSVIYVTVVVSEATPRVLAKLPRPKRNGQQILFDLRQSVSAFTVVNSSVNKRTSIGADITLPVNTTLRLVGHNGVWRKG